MTIKKWVSAIAVVLFLMLAIVAATFQYSRSWERAFFLQPFHQLEHKGRVVALTFDDGPSPNRTPPLLDLLKEKQVKATFFMLGENIEKYPDLAQRVLDEGHLIGNHSYNHPQMIFKSPSFLRTQIERTDSLIRHLGQDDLRYFRPPYCSKYLVLPSLLSSMNKFLVTGTYDPPSEYSSPYPAQKVAQEVIDNTKPGSIIFLHDGKSSDVPEFVASVSIIITALSEQGYRFVKLDQTEE